MHETSVAILKAMAKNHTWCKEQIWAFICKNHHAVINASTQRLRTITSTSCMPSHGSTASLNQVHCLPSFFIIHEQCCCTSPTTCSSAHARAHTHAHVCMLTCTPCTPTERSRCQRRSLHKKSLRSEHRIHDHKQNKLRKLIERSQAAIKQIQAHKVIARSAHKAPATGANPGFPLFAREH